MFQGLLSYWHFSQAPLHLSTAFQQVNNIRRQIKEKNWQCYLPLLVQPILVVKMVLHVWLKNKQSIIYKTLQKELAFTKLRQDAYNFLIILFL